jgi:hypothetical protein
VVDSITNFPILNLDKDDVPEKIKLKYAQLIMALKQILPAKMMPTANDAMDLICRFTVNSMSIQLRLSI